VDHRCDASRNARGGCDNTQSMENSNLYTFSTIAQALGGAFAQIARTTAAREEPSFEVLATKTRLRAGQSLHFFLTLAFWVAVSLTFLVMTASVAIIPYALDNRGATNT
jgi:hypothetical protein